MDVMGLNNCLMCQHFNADNGNCMAVGGFCTAVPAAKCPLLGEYLKTGLMPNDVLDLIGAHGMAILDLVEAKEREKVRHGRWIRQQSGFGYSVWKCSICGRVLLPQTSPLLSNMEHLNDRYPYCHCGVKMDGG